MNTTPTPTQSLLTKKAEPPPTRDVNRDSGTDRANGGWLRRLVRPLATIYKHKMKKLSSKTEAMIHDRTTAMTRDILTGRHDSPEQIRKAIRRFERDKHNGKIKPSNERL
jgi:hypothetical protein